MTNYITYNETLTMLYLSLLVYDYNTNSDFTFTENQTIEQYVNSMNKKYINGINDISLSKLEKKGILFLKEHFSDGQVIYFMDNKNIQLAIIKSNLLKTVVIVFRGTDSFRDILYDCYIVKKYLEKNIFVHGGFYNQLNSVYGNLMDFLDPYLTNDFNIFISGHSAGGAHSTIFSYLLAKKTEKIIKVVTFGCPRIGNYEWKESYESIENIINYRIINNNDIITAIPCFDYYHVGINLILTDTDLIINNESDCTTNFKLICYSFCDHCLIKYYHNFINKEHLFNKIIITSELDNLNTTISSLSSCNSSNESISDISNECCFNN